MRFLGFLFLTVFFLSGCTELELASHLLKKASPVPKSEGRFKVGNPYQIKGDWYYPKEQYDLVETGIASWYGNDFHGKKTANGEIYDMYELTAAHRTLQMPSLVRVTNLENGRSLIVRVNDRGPYKKSRIIDLSKRAAELLGYAGKGTAKVKLEVLRAESQRIAKIAKAGRDTGGYEILANRQRQKQVQRRDAPVRVVSAARTAEPYKVAILQPSAGNPKRHSRSPVRVPVERREIVATSLKERPNVKSVIPGHTRGGAFYPDAVVTEMFVKPTNIYIQAGSFSSQDNARRLQQELADIARFAVYPATVNGKKFYRVRSGPTKNVADADRILNRLSDIGHDSAMILVE